jgi:hypothetical protein
VCNVIERLRLLADDMLDMPQICRHNHNVRPIVAVNIALVRRIMKTPNTVLLLALSCALASAAEIERKTFSMSLPQGWTEDTKNDMHDPDSFIFFENSESCLFTVIIGTKSAGAAVADMFKPQKEKWEKKVTDMKSTPIEKWGTYQGKGIEIEGKMQGILRYRVRLFGFESNDYACVITESSTDGDSKTFAADFEKIRQTFRLK